MSNEDYDIFTPAEAVKYLKEKRGLIFTVDGLRNRRRNKQAIARHVLSNTTLWTRAELDAIQPSRKTKRVPVEKKDDDEESQNSSVMLIAFGGQPQQYRNIA